MPSMRNLSILMAIGIVLTAAPGNAQVASAPAVTLRLAVDDSGTNAPISGAIIELVGTNAIARTDTSGAARFDGVAVGRQRVRVRAVGYRPFDALVNVIRLAPGDDSATLIDLAPIPTELRTVTVHAARVEHDPDAFEARRRAGLGHVVFDTTFQNEWARPLADVLAAHVPGVRSAVVHGMHVLVSAAPKLSFHSGGAVECPLDVWVDGVHQGGGFDPDAVSAFHVAAAEVYSTASAPVEFRRSAGGDSFGRAECGVLLLWTKR